MLNKKKLKKQKLREKERRSSAVVGVTNSKLDHVNTMLESMEEEPVITHQRSMTDSNTKLARAMQSDTMQKEIKEALKKKERAQAMENAAVITGKKKVKSMDTLLSALASEGGSQGKVSSKRKHLVFKEEIKEIMYGSNGKKGLEKSRKVGDREAKEEDKDTCFNLMSIDEYFSHRIVPLVRLYEYKAPLLNSRLTTLEVVSFIFTSFGALLAVINLAHWVAITVAIAASLESYISHSGLRQQRDILNKNIKEIQNMLTWWDSLTIVERRQLQNREKAVMTTEECFIAYAEKVSGCQRVTELEMERGQGSGQTGDSKNANSGKNQDEGGADSGDEADDEGE